MRIGVDTTVWTNPRGYGRQARGLLTALLETPSRHHFVFFIDQATCHNSRFPLPKGPEYVVIPTSVSPAEAASATSSRSLRDMYAISAALSRTSADESHPLDVLFYPSVFTYVPCLTRAVVLLGVHDVIAEEYPEFVFPRMGLIRHHLQRLMWATKGWLGRKQSDYIVTVSDYAKAGIGRRSGSGWSEKPPTRCSGL
ncbi:MAG: hypothetical protein ACE5GO_08060 [Anaerolineales bacterium]